MTNFTVKQCTSDSTGTDFKLSFSTPDGRKAEAPTLSAPNLALAIGVVLIKNPELAQDSGVPLEVLSGCKRLGILGAQALGNYILAAHHESVEKEIMGLAQGQEFNLSLEQLTFDSSTRSVRQGQYLNKSCLDDLM